MVPSACERCERKSQRGVRLDPSARVPASHAADGKGPRREGARREPPCVQILELSPDRRGRFGGGERRDRHASLARLVDLAPEPSHRAARQSDRHRHLVVDSVPNDPKPSLRNDRHGLLRGLPEADVVAAGRGQELVDQRCEVLLRAERVVENYSRPEEPASRVGDDASAGDEALEVWIEGDREGVGAVAVLQVEELDGAMRQQRSGRQLYDETRCLRSVNGERILAGVESRKTQYV